MNSSVLKKIISAFIAILLLIYVGNQIYNANYSQVKTQTAVSANASDTVQTKAIVIRKEILLTQTTPGVVGYTLSNGSNVARGGEVAKLYSSPKDANVQQQLNRLDDEIEKLTKLNDLSNTLAASPDLLDKQINQKLSGLLDSIHSGEYSQLPSNRADVLYLLNERQVATLKVSNFNQKISELKNKRNSLAASGGTTTGNITSPADGFFISAADGYESLVSYDNALSLTASDIKSKQSQKCAVPNNIIGKICSNFDWYFACDLPADSASKFKVGNFVDITLPFASAQSVPAIVSAVNQKSSNSEAAVILKCSYMNSSLANIRNETIQIQIEDYAGIRVNQQSIHFVNKFTDKNGKAVTQKEAIKGVYVMHGSQIEFVQVIPIFSTGNYVICDDEPANDKIQTYSTLKLYDEVVTEGTNLYDGKVVK